MKAENMRTFGTIDNIPAFLTEGEQVASLGALKLLGRKAIPTANKIAKETGLNDMELMRKQMPQGYAYGTPLPRGVQRIGNSYETIAAPRPNPQPLAIGNVPYGHALPQGVRRVEDSYTDDYSGNFTARGRSPFVNGFGEPLEEGESTDAYGYADGTLEEQGVLRPLQPPGLIDTFKGIFSPAEERPDLPRRNPADYAPTLEQSRANYELQRQQPLGVKGYAEGTSEEEGATYPTVAGLPDIGGAIRSGYNKFSNLLNTKANGMRLSPPAPDSGLVPTLRDAGSYAADNIRRSAQQVSDFISSPAQASPLPQAQPVAQAQPAAPQQPQLGARLTRQGNTSTLSGDGYSVSSKSPKFGRNSTPESLAALDRTIAYNQTPEAKAQFAANAALSQARYDELNRSNAVDANAARRAELERVALGANFGTQSLGEFLAAKGRAKAAQGLLDLDQGQQRIDQAGQTLQENVRQFDVGAQSAQEKARLDAESPDYTTVDEYSKTPDQSGEYPKIGQKLVNKKTGLSLEQDNFAQRTKNPQYSALVKKFGQEQADSMYLQKLRAALG